MLATVRPRDVAGKTRRRMAAEELADLVALDRKSKKIKADLKAAVVARGSTLVEVHGIGPSGAARILADVGGIARFADRNRLASWTGTAPLDASSGEQIRHRLSRAGNRRMNHVIHIAAIVQLRHDTEGRAYYRRKLAAGKTPMEALSLQSGNRVVLAVLPPMPQEAFLVGQNHLKRHGLDKMKRRMGAPRRTAGKRLTKRQA